MNRVLWEAPFINEKRCPPWPCPIYRKGFVGLVASSLTWKETNDSKRARHADDWWPDWVEYVFTAWGECSTCKQPFAISGTGGIEIVIGEDGTAEDKEKFFVPKMCNPMPEIFEIPTECPKEVCDELGATFKLFWSNSAACGAQLRVALERLMDALSIPKRKKVGAKYSDLSLHARIALFGKNEPILGAQLLALKWLGNSGSHDSKMSRSDLFGRVRNNGTRAGRGCRQAL